MFPSGKTCDAATKLVWGLDQVFSTSIQIPEPKTLLPVSQDLTIAFQEGHLKDSSSVVKRVQGTRIPRVVSLAPVEDAELVQAGLDEQTFAVQAEGGTVSCEIVSQFWRKSGGRCVRARPSGCSQSLSMQTRPAPKEIPEIVPV